MELILVGRVLLRRWYLVLIPVIITAIFAAPDVINENSAAAGGFSAEIRYSAAQQLNALPGREGDLQDLWNASALTVDALTAWAFSSSFADEVIRNVRDVHAVEINRAALGVAADNQRTVGQLIISYPVAEELELITQAAITVLTNNSQDYFPQLGEQPAQVRILQQPHIVAVPPPIANRLEPLVKIGIGLLAGIGLAFLADYLDTSLRRREDVEALGLTVIGTIPPY